MHSELTSIWQDIDNDPTVSAAILLTGAGKAFSAGGDFDLVDAIIAEFDPRMRAPGRKRATSSTTSSTAASRSSRAINGAGGRRRAGAARILADISIATKSARMIDGHTQLGVAAGDHAAIIWPLLCGMAKAKYYLLLCEPISGEEAERIGLVSLAVPDDGELQARALARRRCGWRKARPTRSAGPSTRSTTG